MKILIDNNLIDLDQVAAISDVVEEHGYDFGPYPVIFKIFLVGVPKPIKIVREYNDFGRLGSTKEKAYTALTKMRERLCNHWCGPSHNYIDLTEK